MLLIRETQKAVLAQASFNLWLVDHARRFFDAQCQQLGLEGTSAFITEAVDRARQHGLIEGPDICRYLDLAFTFGSSFDRALPWAQAILGAADGRASVITMDRLYDTAMALLDPESARATDAAQLTHELDGEDEDAASADGSSAAVADAGDAGDAGLDHGRST